MFSRPLCGSEHPTRSFLVAHVHRVTAAMARGKRPVTFRTRKVSLSAPMVLPWRRGGRVGRRRTNFPEGAPASVLGPLSPFPHPRGSPRHAREEHRPPVQKPEPDRGAFCTESRE